MLSTCARLLLTWGQIPFWICTPSCKRQCVITTECWRSGFQRRFTTKIWEATTCLHLVNLLAHTRTSRPTFLPTTLVLRKASILESLSKITADQPPSHHIHILPNPLPNRNMPPTTNVPRCPVLLSINTPSSSSSSRHHDRIAGGHLHSQTSIRPSQIILPVRLLPLK